MARKVTLEVFATDESASVQVCNSHFRTMLTLCGFAEFSVCVCGVRSTGHFVQDGTDDYCQATVYHGREVRSSQQALRTSRYEVHRRGEHETVECYFPLCFFLISSVTFSGFFWVPQISFVFIYTLASIFHTVPDPRNIRKHSVNTSWHPTPHLLMGLLRCHLHYIFPLSLSHIGSGICLAILLEDTSFRDQPCISLLTLLPTSHALWSLRDQTTPSRRFLIGLKDAKCKRGPTEV